MRLLWQRVRILTRALRTCLEAVRVHEAREAARASSPFARSADRPDSIVVIRTGDRISVSLLQEEITSDDVVELSIRKKLARRYEREPDWCVKDWLRRR